MPSKGVKGVRDLGAARPEGQDMAKSQQKSNKEIRKPKKAKVKSIAAAPSRGMVNDIKDR